MNARIPFIVLLGLSAALAQAQSSMQNETQPSATPGSTLTPDPLPPDSATPLRPQTPSPSTSGANAAGMGASSTAGQAEFAIPPAATMLGMSAKTENGVTYLCGGVGKEEASFMKQHGREHDLMLTFATRKGEYLANVDVSIQNAQGKALLQTTCDGPLMAVDLPKSGTYRIHAVAGGQTLDRTAHVNVNKRRASASVVMTWPQSVGAGLPTATGSSLSEGRSESGQPRTPLPR